MGDDETAMQAGGDEAQVGDKWGDDITPHRKAWLEEQLQAWEANHGEKRGPFDVGKAALDFDNAFMLMKTLGKHGISFRGTALRAFERTSLTGADVFWLAARSLAHSPDEVATDEIKEVVPETTLELHWLRDLHLEGASLLGAHLEGSILNGAHLEGASLLGANLEGASLLGTHLEGASLINAHLEGASLINAHLEGASLVGAHLEGGEFDKEGSKLWPTQKHKSETIEKLPSADLRGAFFNYATQLGGVTLGVTDRKCARIADIRWGDANLAVVDWDTISALGDETTARKWKPSNLDALEPRPMERPAEREQREQRTKQWQHEHRIELYRTAARANRQLATALRSQGVSDEADRFAYRAQSLQRIVLRLQHKYPGWFWSWFLEILAGYGYHPIRTLGVYIGIVSGFACFYQRVGPAAHLHMSFLAALVMSVASFHGRGLFPTPNVPLDSPLAVLGAMEAIVGLVIEASFIATFTQRFFAR